MSLSDSDALRNSDFYFGLDRGMTRDEALALTRIEGIWGFGPKDRPVVEALANEGLVQLDEVHGQPVVVKL